MPIPTKMPIASVSPSAVLEFAMNTRPSAYSRPPAKSTRLAPKRSASIPVNGCVMPHSKFCTATAKPNTSRPQPLSMLIGCRNSPKLWRTPGASVIMTLALGVRHSFGLFLQPMSMDNGWGREVFGFAVAVQNLLWGITQPFTGMLADRFGARRVLFAGGLLYALGLVLMANSTTALGL